MTDLLITMNSSGTFTLPSDAGRIEEYCAKRLKIKLTNDFLTENIKYYTLSFEPYSLSRKIITENIYRDSSVTEGIYFSNGYIFCPVYDYIAVSPTVLVQIDAYETDTSGNVTAIIKSGIFTLEFAPSLTGEGMMLETVRPDVKFMENVHDAVTQSLENMEIDGAKLKNYSVTGQKLAVFTVTSNNLQTGSVTSAKLTDGAVTAEKLGDTSVTNAKLTDGCVTEEKIAEEAVTTDKIGDKTVTSAKLADASVLNVKLANYSVGETKIRPLSVSTSKIQDGAVTPAKLDRAYLTEHQSLNAYATEEWVKKQNYLTEHVSLDGYATQEWVENQNYLTEHVSLDGYATEEWIREQNYLTQDHDIVSREELPEKLSELENDVAVSFLSQTLTDEQKLTAIENIGAVKKEEGKTLSQNDFTDEDKAKLDFALTEHQDISMKADTSSLAAVSFSGSYNDLSDLPENCGFTEELKGNYDTAYDHSLSAHAPVNAEENVIESVTLNGKTVEIENKNVSLSVIGFEEREAVFMEV